MSGGGASERYWWWLDEHSTTTLLSASTPEPPSLTADVSTNTFFSCRSASTVTTWCHSPVCGLIVDLNGEDENSGAGWIQEEEEDSDDEDEEEDEEEKQNKVEGGKYTRTNRRRDSVSPTTSSSSVYGARCSVGDSGLDSSSEDQQEDDEITWELARAVLCSNRVSQMTKTYNDIEAVTRLLEEKEKDLELAARIGQGLLSRNKALEDRATSLEAELGAANEKATQLQHELVMKTELLQIYTNDGEDSGSETGTPTGIPRINFDLLQKRIGSLEEENVSLRNEACRLAIDTQDCEQKEQKLVSDVVSQLSEANTQLKILSDELTRRGEENIRYQEEVTLLLAQVLDLQSRMRQMTCDNEELSGMLQAARECQTELTTELADFKDKYAEVLGLLREAQEQLRRQRRQGMPCAKGGSSILPSVVAGSGGLFNESIASELESSLSSELSFDSGIGVDFRMQGNSAFRRVFDTVRTASKPMQRHAQHLQQNQGFACLSSATSTTASMSSSPRIPTLGCIGPTHRVSYNPSSSFPSLDSAGQSDSESSGLTDDGEDITYPAGSRSGIPGVPGSADLEAALRRLTPTEVAARRASLALGYDSTGSSTDFLPYGCRTPDSIMSTGSGRSGFSGYSGHSGWRLPDKLQIVKPLEGSLTLQQWSQLATPHLGSLLEERPGVASRGGRQLDDLLGTETYTLSDLEEDEECMYPGKSFQHTQSIYTYTDSTVLHPDDMTAVTPSIQGAQMSSVPAASSMPPSCVPTPMVMSACASGTATPRPLSRRGSTSTFSTTVGLASLLNERGIKAVTPSAVSTPTAEYSFTPTATPCNSPDGTPPPSPPPYGAIKLPGFFASGADLLKRTLAGQVAKPVPRRPRASNLSTKEKKVLTSMNLVEKLERIGLDNIITTSAGSSTTLSPLTLQGALYTRRSVKSPMAQLTSLKSIAQPSTSASAATTQALHSTPQVTASPQRSLILSPAERLPSHLPPQLGTPGRPGTGVLKFGALTRPDLGTVTPTGSGRRPMIGLGTVPGPVDGSPDAEVSVIGTIGTLFFGRKGGLL